MLHFGEESPSEGDMSYRLASGLASRMWEEKDKDFKPISSRENLKDLHYLYSN